MTHRVLTLLLLGALLAAASPAQHAHDHGAAGHQHGGGQSSAEAAPEATTQAGHGVRHTGPPEHSFADAEAWAERFESEERDEWQLPARVVEALALSPGDDVADIGSGTGYFTRRFAAVIAPGGTAYATDVEPAMAEYVRRRADEDGQRNLVPVLASYDDPRLPDGSIDLVFICNTWHHIQDRVDYARRLTRDLAAGGRVAILDFLPGELPVGPGPEHKLSAEQVAEEFRQAGFRQIAHHGFLPYQYLLVFEPQADRSVDAAPGTGRR